VVKRQQTTERDLFLRELGFEPKPLLVQEFGRLSPSGVKQLEAAVIEAFKIYYWDRFTHHLKPPSSKVDHYELVGAAAERLTCLLTGEPEGHSRQDAAELEPIPDRGLAAAPCVALLEQVDISDFAYSILASTRPSPGGAVVEGTLRGKPFWLTQHAALRLATLYLAPLGRAAHVARLEAAAELKPGKGGRRAHGKQGNGPAASPLDQGVRPNAPSLPQERRAPRLFKRWTS
jgi:hypothetical protein